MLSLLFNLLFSSQLYAQEAAQAGQQSLLMSLFPFLLIFIIFYFLLIRPQKRRLEQEQSMISALSKGDEIYTKSGILGTIVGLTDKVITLQVADGVKFKVLRSQVGGLSSKLFEKNEKSTEKTAEKVKTKA